PPCSGRCCEVYAPGFVVNFGNARRARNPLRDEPWLRRDEMLSNQRSTSERLVEQRRGARGVREAFGHPAVLDRAQDARHLGTGGDAAGDDLPALEREPRDIPALERSDRRARQQQPVERFVAAETV